MIIAEKSLIFSIYIQLGMLLIFVTILSINIRTLKKELNSLENIMLYFSIAVALCEALYHYGFIISNKGLLAFSFIVEVIALSQITFVLSLMVNREFGFKFLDNMFKRVIVSIPIVIAQVLLISGFFNEKAILFDIGASEANAGFNGVIYYLIQVVYRLSIFAMCVKACYDRKNKGSNYDYALVYLLTVVTSMLFDFTQGTLLGIFNTSYTIVILPIFFIYLYKYIRYNTNVEKRSVLIEHDLNTAKNIQVSMLPGADSINDDKSYDIYAVMHPARHVGGDFYDFYDIDEDHIAVCIADVSDKGVAAALFMSKCITLIKNTTLLVKDPSKVLQQVNHILASESKEEMFVTVWLGILDKNTGVLTCANAGHEYPVIKEKDKDFYLMHDPRGMVVGMIDNLVYSNYEIEMNAGDIIFVYSDGVPEASNIDKEMFTMDVMVEELNKNNSDNPKQIVDVMYDKVMDFTGIAKQFDDITMLCLKYNGRS